MPVTRLLFRLLALCLLLCTLPACSTRGDVVSQDYMTLELDGQPLVLSESVTALAFDSAKRVDILSVGGREDKDPQSQGFFFQLSGGGLRPGTYTTDDAVVHVNYHGNAATGTSTLVYAANRMLGTRFTVRLTALGRDGVQGTFSGTLVRQGDGPTPERVTVTNGRFAVRYRQGTSGDR